MRRDVQAKLTFVARVELVSRGRLVLVPTCEASDLVRFVGAETVLVTLQGDVPFEDDLKPAAQP